VFLRLIFVLALMTSVMQSAFAQTEGARALVSRPIDTSQWVTLRGNTRSEANNANDRGAVPDSLSMQHMQLLLKRPAEREAALQTYIKSLHDRASPNFHRWLSAKELGQRYGLAASDLSAIESWLTSQGFIVHSISTSTLIVDFSGTAAQVRMAFHTQLHYLRSRGVRHVANMSDPQIPAALADAIVGVVSLNDFRPHTNFKPRTVFTFAVNGGTDFAVVPGDLATIYNLSPLFSNGTSGQGQTVVVIEDSDVFSTTDWTTFRTTFGLSGFSSGSFTQVHPAPVSGTSNCADPGVVAQNEGEAELDAEWASAAAPSAAIVLASCKDTSTTFGGLIAIQNLVDGSSPPAILSLSFGECEAENGAAGNAAFNAIYEQAVSEGTSVFVSSGDEGAASCDANESAATHGIAVSGFASTPFNVAVGGTDFGDTFAGTTSTYWGSSNSSVFESALSYIPEIPWNDSCAGALLASFEGFNTGFGTGGFCNSTQASNFLTTASGSGGPSGCATGSTSTSGVVSGSCQGYAKPSWQNVSGNPADGVRDLPDVSLFAGNGIWGHFYIYCDSDTSDGGAACSGSPAGWSKAGGTSFSTPILAGIQALVNQSTAARQGNPNPVYYALAASQYASSLVCNATRGNAVAGGCVFYDVQQGDMDVNCSGSHSCFDPAGSNGVLSTSSSSFASAYASGAGWDFATGLGSLNAANLVSFWNSSDLSLAGSATVNGSGVADYSLTVRNNGPQTATSVSVTTTLPGGSNLAGGSSSACVQSGLSVKCTLGSLMQGANASVTIAVQPASTLSFTASSGNSDLNPGNNTLALVAGGSDAPATDGPLPLWSYLALGLLMLAIVRLRVQSPE
jgi:uncharacterized repeat protein (TIGR01451 family)